MALSSILSLGLHLTIFLFFYYGLPFSKINETKTTYEFITGDFALKCEILNNQVYEIFIKNFKTDINYTTLHDFLTKTGGETGDLVQSLTETVTSSPESTTAVTMATVAAHPVVRSAITAAVSSVFNANVATTLGLNEGDIIDDREGSRDPDILNDSNSLDSLPSTTSISRELSTHSTGEGTIDKTLLLKRITEDLF